MPSNQYLDLLQPMRQYSKLETIQKLQELRYIHDAHPCLHCDYVMCLRQDKTIDGYVWQCRNAGCAKYKTTISVRAGSFFANYKLSLVDLLTITYHWCNGIPVGKVERYVRCTRKTASSVYDHCRQVVGHFLDNNPVRLGGPGVICQIDESEFAHKCKAHRGRAPLATVWVFGIVDTSFEPARCYMQVVPDRQKTTLYPIMESVCLPGTIIHSDEYPTYRALQRTIGFNHGSVNHTLHFVDPDSGVHTQHVESSWATSKLPIKCSKGLRRDQLPLYLQECMWRNLVGQNAFARFLELIRR
jgi:transposase-like protein